MCANPSLTSHEAHILRMLGRELLRQISLRQIDQIIRKLAAPRGLACLKFIFVK